MCPTPDDKALMVRVGSNEIEIKLRTMRTLYTVSDRRLCATEKFQLPTLNVLFVSNR